MKRLGMGIVGVGFVGPHHIDAVRRLGYVDIVGVADLNEKLAKEKADQLHVPKSYGSYEALLDDPEIQVVHNATPNYLHYPVNVAAIKRGKHVICDKPLAMTAKEAKELVDLANAAGIVHGVTFGYRGNPLVQHARVAIAKGEIGKPHFLHGYYLQDWLLKDTDYSWRLEPDKSGISSALGDIGSHWCDLAQHVSGLRITHVLGDITTTVPKRKKPRGAREAFQAAGSDDAYELVDIKVEDLASVLLRFDNGAKGAFSVGQVCAGHKNDLLLEVCASVKSLRWRQEHQNELWIGNRDRSNEILQKDPALIEADARTFAHLPGGHQEGWPDANFNVMRTIYSYIQSGGKGDRPAAMATFEDGYRANAIVEAVIESARQGSVWTQVSY